MFSRVLLLIFILFSANASAKDTVRLTSLYWPPYSGPDLVGEGASIAVVRAAFESMGFKLEVAYYPWPRTLAKAEDPDSVYLGYTPEYYSPLVESKFIFSDMIGESPLAIIQRKTDPIHWNNTMDLRDYRIGVVRGYVNTTEFDYAVDRGVLEVDQSIDDATNLRKILHKRLDGVVMDPNVMDYLLKTHDEFSELSGQIEANDKLLEMKKLFVCFRRSDKGKKWVEVLNQGLKKIDRSKIYREYLEKNNR